MVTNKNLSLTADPKGVLFLFGAVFAAVMYGILLKKLTVHYSSITIIAYQNMLGAVLFLPLFLIFDFQKFIVVKPTAELISSLLMLAVFASSMAYIFYTSTVRKIGISRANLYSNSIPIFAGITSYFILSEQFTVSKISGMMIVIFGIILSQLTRRNTKVAFHKTKNRSPDDLG
jgi:drug/metabolite transporter (DMT)-like permease